MKHRPKPHAPPVPPDAPLPLLGGMSPERFMRRHWQRKPLLVRNAWPGVVSPVGREALRALSAGDDVESRIVEQHARGPSGWRLRQGPFTPRQWPAWSRPGWTALVQGLDAHVDAARAMLDRFRFIADARVDDLMISYASDGGGVGAHVDAYDVFLLQVSGRRRWRWGPPPKGDAARCVPDVPLKLLATFEPTDEALLEPGDLLYLPPHWAHDGVAVGGDCMTCSIGFRAPSHGELLRGVLAQWLDAEEDGAIEGEAVLDPRFGDAGVAPVDAPGRIPPALEAFALEALQRALKDGAWQRALGCWMTQPKPRIVFAPERALPQQRDGIGVRLARATRMAWDERHVYVNGEAFHAGGRDARLLRRLADARRLDEADVLRLSDEARAVVAEWLQDGWLQPDASTA